LEGGPILRWPTYFVVSLILIAPNCHAQCTPESPHFDRYVDQTHLQCEYSDGTSSDMIKWKITKPDVAKQLTDYRDVTFSPGDEVLVSAGGCVDVARKPGKHDWRRYVDPQGGNTDRYFHGLIWIPGASVRENSELLVVPAGTAPVRMSSISGSQSDPSNVQLLTIQAPPEGTLPTLRLGYEVDYDRTDKRGKRPLALYATGNMPETEVVKHSGQCKDERIWSVSLVIKRARQSTTSEFRSDQTETRPTRSLLPFDPVSGQRDTNGFMLSPLWYGNLGKPETSALEVVDDCKNFEYKHWFFVRYGVKAPCSQAASFDVPPGFLTECTFAPGFGQLHGHVNWAPATFEGELSWIEHSADQDEGLQLKTLSDYDRSQRFAGNTDFGRVGGILTRDSQGLADYKDALWLEFASYETVEDFPALRDSSHEDWKNLEDLLSAAQRHTAIVTGLLNLDCVHECHTELHPVLTLAFRTNDETSADDRWGIFVRNSGNEGDCSADAHYLSRDSYTFFLPAPTGATLQIPEVKNRDTAFMASEAGITWSISAPPRSRGPGVLLRFSFAPAACTQIHEGSEPVRITGILQLNWAGSDSQPMDLHSSLPYHVIWKDGDTQVKELTCSPNDNVLSDNLSESEKRSVQIHHAHPACKSPRCLASALGEFVGREFGVFPDILLYNKTSQVEINPGFRYSLVQTSLGSFEFDASPGLSRSARSTDGTNLTVRMSDFFYGFKLRFPSALNIFAETKGGMVFRSASSGYSSTPDFFRFRGHDSLFLIGGGIEPGKPSRTFGLDVSIRLSADYMYLPGTGEHMVRLTIGPQFQIPKRARD
jgi:hypothetical protein